MDHVCAGPLRNLGLRRRRKDRSADMDWASLPYTVATPSARVLDVRSVLGSVQARQIAVA
jgi:hypothetical protein